VIGVFPYRGQSVRFMPERVFLGKTMIKRNIFTKRDIRDNGILDLILALAIAAGGLILTLAYFDILVK